MGESEKSTRLKRDTRKTVAYEGRKSKKKKRGVNNFPGTVCFTAGDAILDQTKWNCERKLV